MDPGPHARRASRHAGNVGPPRCNHGRGQPSNAFAAAVKGSELMEFACAEGSQTLPNIFGFGFFPGQ